MKRNLQNGDWEQLRINAHSLKPQADFMGIKSLKEELIKIEDAVRLNKLEEIEQLFNNFLTISTNSENILKEMLGKI